MELYSFDQNPYADHFIRHGKDNKLVVWKLTEEDELLMITSLPVDDLTLQRKQPWLLHVLHVNTLNFCSFAHCNFHGKVEEALSDDVVKPQNLDELLIAVPNTMTSEAVRNLGPSAVLRLISLTG